VQATGHNATALGSNTVAAGENSIAVGSYNIAQGVDDQLFVVGNGTDNSHRANAVTILRNGNMGVGTYAPTAKLEVNGDTNLHGDLTVDGVIRVMPQGDLSMGEFTQSPTP
jgi:hypothetical protein